jgi:PQQ-dependent catabolism-associated CXXCW motif protein
LPPGTIWREKPRRNIPGGVWLPDTGYGALAPATEDYLRGNLARVTEGDRTKALVVYCLRDCWMSWNAAKRILSIGYANVVWYPDGTDGWAEAGLPLRESMPEPSSSQ